MDGPCAGAGGGGGGGAGGGACWYPCCWYPCWPCACCASRSSRRAFCSSSYDCRSAWFLAWAFPAMYAPPPTAAARSNGRLRLIITASLISPCYVPLLHTVGQAEAQRK